MSRRNPHRKSMIEKILNDTPPQEAGAAKDYHFSRH
jgi:hypothetical protein